MNPKPNNDLKTFQDSVEELQQKLKHITSLVGGIQRSLTALKTRTEPTIVSPDNMHIVAHEVNEKQIDTLFMMYPWMEYLKFSDGKILSRAQWNLEQNEKKKRASGTYNVT